MTSLPKSWLTRKEVAAYASVSISTINRWIKAGLLKSHAVKIANNRHGVIRFKASEVEAVFESAQ